MRTGRLTAAALLLSLGACGGPVNATPAARAEMPERPPSPPLPTNLDAEGLRRELRRRGLERNADRIVQLAKPCLLLQRRSDAALAAPTSRLGGAPDLAHDAEWPQWRGKPQAFLAQLRLEELPADIVPELPARGVLSFFYDAGQSAGDYDADGSYCVMFTEDTASCVPRSFPDGLASSARFRAVPVHAEAALSLPYSPHTEVDALELDDADSEELGELVHELHWRGQGHQVGGEPLPIQGGYMTDADDADSRADDWVLLLQLESDDAPGWMWGDAGALYFWIRRADLAARRFDRTTMIYECH